MKLLCSTLYDRVSRGRVGARIVLAIMAFVVVPACSSDGPTATQAVPGTVTMSQAALNLIVGANSNLTVTVRDTDGATMTSPTVAWTSNATGVASVSGSGTSATVTAVGPGSATITATSGTVSATSTVTVAPAQGFAAVVQPIFDQSCVGCHSVGGQAEGVLILSSGSSHGNIVSVAAGQLSSMSLIEPDDPANSYLLHKVQGTHLDVGGSGQQMPRGGTPLSQSLIDALIAWVNDGAPND